MNEERYDVRQEIRSDIWLIIIIAAMLISAFAIYGSLPEKIPMHWNINGEIDQYGTRNSIFLLPLMNVGIYFAMLFSPLIDPKRNNYGKFKGAYRLIRAIIVLILTIFYVIVAMASMGYEVKVDFIIPFSISVMFIIIGNYLGKIRHNYFVGIKTPWTLADERVWVKTHRLGGPMFVVAGLVSMVGSFMGGKWAFTLLLISVMTATIIPIVYSYILYNRLTKQ